MFRVRKRSMSDTPIEAWMNSDTLLGCAVSFVLRVGILWFLETSAAAARTLTFLNTLHDLLKRLQKYWFKV